VRSALERERSISAPGLPEEAVVVTREPERLAAPGVAVQLKPAVPETQPSKLILVSNKIRESEVLEDLANIRLNLYLSGEERYIPEFQKIEGLFYEIIQTDTAEDQSYIEMHKMYQTAERHLLNREYFDALKYYYLVAHRRPESLLAFLARFQIANLNFEVLRDYQGALMNYEKCLENYPAHFISEEKKDIILDRMELLTKNGQDNWRSLRLYHRARASRPEIAKLLYQEILESYPNSTLVQSCIEALTNFAIAEQYEGAVTPVEIIALLQSYSERWPQNPSRVYVQLGIADILNYRLHNYQQALLEYVRVVNTSSDSKVTQVAKERIHRLYQRGFSASE
jgi:tetratricopeptide (TPR) repeat protein